MSSRFKKAHKTHGFAQPAGVPYPHLVKGELAGSRAGTDEQLLQRFVALCKLVEDETERAGMLGVTVRVDAAWCEGKMLPLLRARRKAIERSLQGLQRTTPVEPRSS